jgi:ABC-2 type transport system permease protein
MKAIYKKELKSYFQSPLIYCIIGVFLLFSLGSFVINNLMTGSPEAAALFMGSGFIGINFIMLLLVPVITMRLFTEEKMLRTEQLLLTSPVSITSVVFAKFLSAFTVYAILIAFTLLYVLIMAATGTVNFMEVLLVYIGALLLGGSLVSIGLLVSSLTNSMVTSVLFSYGAMIFTYFYTDILYAVFSGSKIMTTIADFLSIQYNFQGFAMGLLSPQNVIYYLSFMGIFIFLTIRVIDKRRWA